MDSKSEREQGRKKIVKKLGERFNPYGLPNPHKIELPSIENVFGVQKTRTNEFYLSLADEANIPLIPFLTATFLVRGQKRNTYTPANPSEGYEVTAEDFDLEKRKKKLQSIDGDVNRKVAPLGWNVTSSSVTDLTESGIAEGTDLLKHRIKNKYLPMIKRLRLQVFFPGSDPEIKYDDPRFRRSSSFEARPSPLSLEFGDINFRNFYPLETGPLKSSGSGSLDIAEGNGFQLPDNPKYLSKIEIEFILLPEEKPHHATPPQSKKPI